MRKQKYKGRCEKRILSKSDEVCRFYSDLQSKYADKLDSDNGIKQIHCNVYLCNTEYMSDFLCTRKNGDVFIRECVERRFLNKPMTIKMLDITKTCKGCDTDRIASKRKVRSKAHVNRVTITKKSVVRIRSKNGGRCETIM